MSASHIAWKPVLCLLKTHFLSSQTPLNDPIYIHMPCKVTSGTQIFPANILHSSTVNTMMVLSSDLLFPSSLLSVLYQRIHQLPYLIIGLLIPVTSFI